MSDYKGKQPVLNRGVYDVASNNHPSSTGLVGSSRDAAPDETTFLNQISSVSGDDDRISLDVALADGDGQGVDYENPLPVYLAADPGVEKCDEDVDTDTAAGASVNHDYTVSALQEFRALTANGTSAGLAKFQLQIETAVASGVFTTVDTKFNSVSNPNVKLECSKPAPVAAGIIIRVVKENCEEDATDTYSYINGVEVVA